MKYSTVKQFSNASIDNIYTFYFKIIDFGKMFYETMWSFLEIWIAFFLIFYNFLMYIYYIFLFMIDKGADESRTTVLHWRKIPKIVSSVPKVKLIHEANPVPSIYGQSKIVAKTTSKVVSTAASAVQTAVSTGKPFSHKAGQKKSVMKSIFESINDFFRALKKIILAPVRIIADFFEKRLSPVKENEQEMVPKNKSLISEYLKEYEQRKK